MRHRLEKEGYKCPETKFPNPTPVEDVPVIQTITLQELAEKTNMSDLKKQFLCIVKLTKVDESKNWWYAGCTDCEGEVLEVEGKVKCVKCPKIIPVAGKIFKIGVQAEDSSEAYNFVIMDRAGRRLLRKTASKMLSEYKQCQTTIFYPAIIKDMVGKEVTLKIEINDDNVLLKSKIFSVTDAYDDSVVSTPSYSLSNSGAFTASNSGDNSIDLSSYRETPDSVKSVSKKIKMEK